MNKARKNNSLACPCGSKKAAKTCCLRLIDGIDLATSAEQLMRSRYSAYALGRTQYILSSWHMSYRPKTLELEVSLKWSGLKVLSSTAPKHNTAYVEFVAGFNKAGVTGQMHERSRFVFEDGQWFYVDGEQMESSTQYQFSPPGRNEPCPCGSGRKFKKCCAKNG